MQAKEFFSEWYQHLNVEKYNACIYNQMLSKLFLLKPNDMAIQQNTSTRQSLKVEMTGIVSINDLRYKEFNNIELSSEEALALRNFDKFRIAELNKITSDEAFHVRYRELQVLANLGDYKEFLKEEYTSL